MSGTIVTTSSVFAIKKTIAFLLPILAAVESSNNPAAVGDGGDAIGTLQIHRSYWGDAMEELGEDWPYSYANRPEYAKKAAQAYLVRYGREYKRITGKVPTVEVLARIHNGGPQGWNPEYPKKYAATSKYWTKVKAKIKN